MSKHPAGIRQRVKHGRPLNEAIAAAQMLVLTGNGEKLGPMSRTAALAMAREAGLDLMLVSQPHAAVAVCKIVDYAKYQFDLAKKQKQQRKKLQTIVKKEIRLKVRIEAADLQVKVNRARSFLQKHQHIKLSLRFRGREVTHPELGYDTLHKFIGYLSDVGIIDGRVGRERMVLHCELKPLRTKAQLQSVPSPHAQNENPERG